jgi:hypothetical protein
VLLGVLGAVARIVAARSNVIRCDLRNYFRFHAVTDERDAKLVRISLHRPVRTALELAELCASAPCTQLRGQFNVFGTSSSCKDTITECARGATTPFRKLALKGCRFRSNAMAADAQRARVYVVTGDGQQVAVYDKSGTRPVRILKKGIDYAYALAVDRQGYLYVANAGSLYSSYGDLTVAIFAPDGVDPQQQFAFGTVSARVLAPSRWTPNEIPTSSIATTLSIVRPTRSSTRATAIGVARSTAWGTTLWQ